MVSIIAVYHFGGLPLRSTTAAHDGSYSQASDPGLGVVDSHGSWGSLAVPAADR
jgi:hypothetical protein